MKTIIRALIYTFIAFSVIQLWASPIRQEFNEIPNKAVERAKLLDRANQLIAKANSSDAEIKEHLLNEAIALCKEVQWGGPDTLFAESLVIHIQALMAKGDKRLAEKMRAEYQSEFSEADAILIKQGDSETNLPSFKLRRLFGEEENSANKAVEGMAPR